MNLDDRLYTSTEVAEILGVSLRSVYRYLEENKLDAEVKTATGRHRFTRKNILDFLYPNKDNTSPSPATRAEPQTERQSIPSTPQLEVEVEEEKKEEAPIEPEVEVQVSEEIVEQSHVSTDPEVKEEEVDWLAKFRAAAEKHRVENQQQFQSTVSNEKVSVLSDVEEKEEEISPQKSEYFYKSNIGGLKELAQYINKTARKSNVAYAFTMNAGLSLHKMIRPFSILHIYAKPEDLDFYEKALELSETGEGNAQLGIFIDRGRILENSKEVHGLYVVSDQQLRKDLIDHGEVDLASEFDEVADL